MAARILRERTYEFAPIRLGIDICPTGPADPLDGHLVSAGLIAYRSRCTSTADRSGGRRKPNELTDLLKVYGPIAAFVIAGFAVAYLFVDPAPPRRLTIATGSPTGAYHGFGQRYQENLGRDGIAVTLVNTAGTVENLSLLDRSAADDAPAPRIDIAFVQSGVGAAVDFPDLVSLASLYFEPLWVLVRADQPPRRFTELAGRRLAIGVEGSGTRHMTRRLLAANGIADGDRHGTEMVDLGGQAAAEALVSAPFFAVARITFRIGWCGSAFRCRGRC